MNEQLRYIIYKRTSEMLDKPDSSGIYPTTKFYNDVINDVQNLFSSHLETIKGDIQKKRHKDIQYAGGRKITVKLLESEKSNNILIDDILSLDSLQNL